MVGWGGGGGGGGGSVVFPEVPGHFFLEKSCL